MRFYLYLWSLSHLLVHHYVIICSSNSQSPPKVRSDVKNPIIYPIGSTVQLQCPVYDDQYFVFYEWSRDINNHEQIEESARYRLNDKGVLKIKSTVVEDSGIYYCKAINGFGYVTTNLTLQIVPNDQLQALNSPMDNLYPRDDNDYLVFESNVNFKYNYKKSTNKQSVRNYSKTLELQKPVGVTVRFNCNARDVRWYKNGANLQTRHLPLGSDVSKRNGMVVISKVRLEDAGNYSCIGKDGQSNTTFHLYVFDNRNKKPELTGFHPINTTLYVGDTAMFQCKVNSEAKPHIQWLKNYASVDKLDSNEAINQGLIPINNEYYRVLKSSQIKNNGDGMFYNKLLIEKTQTTDSGKYICIAANSLGYSYKIAHLIVLPPVSDIDHSNYSEAIKTTNIAIFWGIFCCITVAVLLLSWLLYTCKSKSIDYAPTTNPEQKFMISQKPGKQFDSNINEWLNTVRMQKNPAYNCGDTAHNSARQQLSKA